MNRSRRGGDGRNAHSSGNRTAQGNRGGEGRDAQGNSNGRGGRDQSKRRGDRDRRNGKDGRRGNNGRRNQEPQKKKPLPLTPERLDLLETINVRLRQDDRDRQNAIDAFRQNVRQCPRCNAPIDDISSALTDPVCGLPIHFDCVLSILKERENCSEDETIAYIGQGKFAILSVGGPASAETGETKHFSIRKTIDWEKPENVGVWRVEMADLYSQVV